MRSITTSCLVLKSINYSDSDKILTLFTDKLGKVSAIAKGIRKIKSRKGGNLDLFTCSKVFLAQGKNLYIVTQAELINPFSNLKSDLKKSSWLYFVAETLDKLLAEEEEQKELFNLVVGELSHADRANGPEEFGLILRSLLAKILTELGFYPKEKFAKELPSLEFLQDAIQNVAERKIHSVGFMDKVSKIYK